MSVALITAAVLLSLERICYVMVWRAPEAFRAWCARPGTRRFGDATDVLALCFIIFKGVQAAVFVGWCVVHGRGNIWPDAPGWALASGSTLILVGQLLNVSVFARLGKTGVFYGNRLGHDVQWRHAFPFTWLRHPQYAGTVMSIWGFFLVMRFPAGDWLALPMLESLYYWIGAHLEDDGPSHVTSRKSQLPSHPAT